MPDYRNGLIYKIKHKTDPTKNQIYIGSTCNFRARKCSHKTACCNPNDKAYMNPFYQYVRQNGGWYEFEMIKIADYPCNLKCELEAEERRYIERKQHTLNKQIPTRTSLS